MLNAQITAKSGPAASGFPSATLCNLITLVKGKSRYIAINQGRSTILSLSYDVFYNFGFDYNCVNLANRQIDE